jgi:hypothetical protein
MCLKFREEITNPPTLVKLLIDDNFEVVLELAFLAFNIKKGSMWCFGIFPFFLRKYEERKNHNMQIQTSY